MELNEAKKLKEQGDKAKEEGKLEEALVIYRNAYAMAKEITDNFLAEISANITQLEQEEHQHALDAANGSLAQDSELDKSLSVRAEALDKLDRTQEATDGLPSGSDDKKEEVVDQNEDQEDGDEVGEKPKGKRQPAKKKQEGSDQDQDGDNLPLKRKWNRAVDGDLRHKPGPSSLLSPIGGKKYEYTQYGGPGLPPKTTSENPAVGDDASAGPLVNGVDINGIGDDLDVTQDSGESAEDIDSELEDEEEEQVGLEYLNTSKALKDDDSSVDYDENKANGKSKKRKADDNKEGQSEGKKKKPT